MRSYYGFDSPSFDLIGEGCDFASGGVRVEHDWGLCIPSLTSTTPASSVWPAGQPGGRLALRDFSAQYLHSFFAVRTSDNRIFICDLSSDSWTGIGRVPDLPGSVLIKLQPLQLNQR